MGRQAKGLRLWLRPARYASGKITHASTWFILDGTRQISTGYGVDQRIEAENELLKHGEGRKIRSRFVYFLTTEKTGFPIKIGITESHHVRVSSLQIALPYDIKIIAMLPVDDPIFERRLHKRFAHLRLRGEWFESAPELHAYIEQMVSESKAA